ncbi:hypothetical protein RERY_46430 [Rhodococcus erythropolis]|nr:hypothetical protein RERY_46430 [Rhodococcus erythropolis]
MINDGTMYDGNTARSESVSATTSTTAPDAGTTYPTKLSPDLAETTVTADADTDASATKADSISPNSIR